MVHLLYFIQVYLLLIWARVTYISEPVKGIKINFMGRGGVKIGLPWQTDGWESLLERFQWCLWWNHPGPEIAYYNVQ